MNLTHVSSKELRMNIFIEIKRFKILESINLELKLYFIYHQSTLFSLEESYKVEQPIMGN